MTQYAVYLHLRPDGSPFYVGKGRIGKGRSRDLCRSRNAYHKNVVAKYGAENIEVIEFPPTSNEQALSDEKRVIAAFREQGILLTNMTDGGDGSLGLTPSIVTRAKMSETRKGKKRPPELGAKISARMMGQRLFLGHKHSPDHIASLVGNKHALGHKHSEETRAKMRAAAARRRQELNPMNVPTANPNPNDESADGA